MNNSKALWWTGPRLHNHLPLVIIFGTFAPILTGTINSLYCICPPESTDALGRPNCYQSLIHTSEQGDRGLERQLRGHCDAVLIFYFDLPLLKLYSDFLNGAYLAPIMVNTPSTLAKMDVVAPHASALLSESK